jgi:hypothetical protein
MKVVSYTALLYGKDYLYYAIKSVIDHVDEHHVIYDQTGHGSHGHITDRECPDTRWELISEATRAAGNKLRWHDAGPFAHEGQQRDFIFQCATDADVILVVDADEIWAEGLAQRLVDVAVRYPTTKYWRVPMIHFWRSFHRAVLHDPAYPVRAILKGGQSELTLSAGGTDAYGYSDWAGVVKYINHMGYAQRSEIVEYKQHTHGHRNEWRRDIDWFNDKFMANAQQDCHPVGSDYWNPETVDPWQYLPEFMKDHPYAKLEVIP